MADSRIPLLRIGAAAIVLALTGCTAMPGSESSVAASSPASAAISRLVDIGGGRSLSLTCRGTGSPTVLLVSGTRGAADEWDTVPTDAPAGTASVFDAVAQTTRVCAYDRPGTMDDAGQPTASTPVTQPTTALDGAHDLDALMRAAGESGPYVVVGLSLGGMIAQQFARTYSGEVEGVVLFDSASEYVMDTMSAEQWSSWMTVIAASADAAGSEVPDYPASIRELRASPSMPPIPATVVSSDQPWDLRVTPGASTWPAWTEAQAELARSLGATHITDTHSGHGIPVEQPALAATAIVDMVDAVRATP